MVESGLTCIDLKSSRGDGYYPALILNYKKKFLFIRIYLLFINIKIYFFEVQILNF